MFRKGQTLVATLMGALLALAIVVAFCTSSLQKGKNLSLRTIRPTLAAGKSAANENKDSTSLDDSRQDSSQQSESETETPAQGGFEEEHAKVLPTAFLFDRHHHEDDGEVARVDHAYDAWFYSVTHPPLTPPPNFS